ncbi:hypothetical protein ADEAN_000614300 [Angomonas deanei]|uniref:Uncharacterized protein n=1 Tax=Angomonas deanei TaxID=59799 RepID=A0A7G2CKB1_9TRYP|nr:hypothetical protein ADEAN_000614300 [Angomonas deanei]
MFGDNALAEDEPQTLTIEEYDERSFEDFSNDLIVKESSISTQLEKLIDHNQQEMERKNDENNELRRLLQTPRPFLIRTPDRPAQASLLQSLTDHLVQSTSQVASAKPHRAATQLGLGKGDAVDALDSTGSTVDHSSRIMDLVQEVKRFSPASEEERSFCRAVVASIESLATVNYDLSRDVSAKESAFRQAAKELQVYKNSLIRLTQTRHRKLETTVVKTESAMVSNVNELLQEEKAALEKCLCELAKTGSLTSVERIKPIVHWKAMQQNLEDTEKMISLLSKELSVRRGMGAMKGSFASRPVECVHSELVCDTLRELDYFDSNLLHGENSLTELLNEESVVLPVYKKTAELQEHFCKVLASVNSAFERLAFNALFTQNLLLHGRSVDIEPMVRTLDTSEVMVQDPAGGSTTRSADMVQDFEALLVSLEAQATPTLGRLDQLIAHLASCVKLDGSLLSDAPVEVEKKWEAAFEKENDSLFEKDIHAMLENSRAFIGECLTSLKSHTADVKSKLSWMEEQDAAQTLRDLLDITRELQTLQESADGPEEVPDEANLLEEITQSKAQLKAVNDELTNIQQEIKALK